MALFSNLFDSILILSKSIRGEEIDLPNVSTSTRASAPEASGTSGSEDEGDVDLFETANEERLAVGAKENGVEAEANGRGGVENGSEVEANGEVESGSEVPIREPDPVPEAVIEADDESAPHHSENEVGSNVPSTITDEELKEAMALIDSDGEGAAEVVANLEKVVVEAEDATLVIERSKPGVEKPTSEDVEEDRSQADPDPDAEAVKVQVKSNNGDDDLEGDAEVSDCESEKTVELNKEDCKAKEAEATPEVLAERIEAVVAAVGKEAENEDAEVEQKENDADTLNLSNETETTASSFHGDQGDEVAEEDEKEEYKTVLGSRTAKAKGDRDGAKGLTLTDIEKEMAALHGEGDESDATSVVVRESPIEEKMERRDSEKEQTPTEKKSGRLKRGPSGKTDDAEAPGGSSKEPLAKRGKGRPKGKKEPDSEEETEINGYLPHPEEEDNNDDDQKPSEQSPPKPPAPSKRGKYRPGPKSKKLLEASKSSQFFTSDEEEGPSGRISKGSSKEEEGPSRRKKMTAKDISQEPQAKVNLSDEDVEGVMGAGVGVEESDHDHDSDIDSDLYVNVSEGEREDYESYEESSSPPPHSAPSKRGKGRPKSKKPRSLEDEVDAESTVESSKEDEDHPQRKATRGRRRGRKGRRSGEVNKRERSEDGEDDMDSDLYVNVSDGEREVNGLSESSPSPSREKVKSRKAQKSQEQSDEDEGDAYVEIESPEPESSKSKKKIRGRKGRSLRKDRSSDDEVNAHDKEEKEADVEEATPSGRCRRPLKRKRDIEESPVEAAPTREPKRGRRARESPEEDEVENVDVVKRRRGRPQKVKPEEGYRPAESKSIPVMESSAEEDESTETESPPRKGQGRKRVVANQELSGSNELFVRESDVKLRREAVVLVSKLQPEALAMRSDPKLKVKPLVRLSRCQIPLGQNETENKPKEEQEISIISRRKAKRSKDIEVEAKEKTEEEQEVSMTSKRKAKRSKGIEADTEEVQREPLTPRRGSKRSKGIKVETEEEEEKERPSGTSRKVAKRSKDIKEVAEHEVKETPLKTSRREVRRSNAMEVESEEEVKETPLRPSKSTDKEPEEGLKERLKNLWRQAENPVSTPPEKGIRSKVIGEDDQTPEETPTKTLRKGGKAKRSKVMEMDAEEEVGEEPLMTSRRGAKRSRDSGKASKWKKRSMEVEVEPESESEESPEPTSRRGPLRSKGKAPEVEEEPPMTSRKGSKRKRLMEMDTEPEEKPEKRPRLTTRKGPSSRSMALASDSETDRKLKQDAVVRIPKLKHSAIQKVTDDKLKRKPVILLSDFALEKEDQEQKQVPDYGNNKAKNMKGKKRGRKSKFKTKAVIDAIKRRRGVRS